VVTDAENEFVLRHISDGDSLQQRGGGDGLAVVVRVEAVEQPRSGVTRQTEDDSVRREIEQESAVVGLLRCRVCTSASMALPARDLSRSRSGVRRCRTGIGSHGLQCRRGRGSSPSSGQKASLPVKRLEGHVAAQGVRETARVTSSTARRTLAEPASPSSLRLRPSCNRGGHRR